MELIDFIIQAKKAGYASDDESQKLRLDNGFHGFEVQGDDGYKYKDVYFGFNPFSGQEHVWKNNELIWSMNYFGKIESKDIDKKEIYTLLKHAMIKIDQQYPFRGPKCLELGEYTYENIQSGDLHQFSGVEKIFFRQSRVFQLNYHGGSLIQY